MGMYIKFLEDLIKWYVIFTTILEKTNYRELLSAILVLQNITELRIYGFDELELLNTFFIRINQILNNVRT
ncbi:hypothetical protein CDIMF43_270022 [Carnobacterium divergens]|nr:hypothetical protein CDIMF43_270022 [Carnobacterium divergens]